MRFSMLVTAGMHECGNCGKVHPAKDLMEIKDLFERVFPGEVMPSGECPACGALCHPVKGVKVAKGKAFHWKATVRRTAIREAQVFVEGADQAAAEEAALAVAGDLDFGSEKESGFEIVGLAAVLVEKDR